MRFLYAVTLGRETLDLMASVPHMKRATRPAEVYARSEVEAILTAPRQPRDRVLLMTVYGCGLRISEATQLKTSDIDRARMQLRVRDGKEAKGRVLPIPGRSRRFTDPVVRYLSSRKCAFVRAGVLTPKETKAEILGIQASVFKNLTTFSCRFSARVPADQRAAYIHRAPIA